MNKSILNRYCHDLVLCDKYRTIRVPLTPYYTGMKFCRSKKICTLCVIIQNPKAHLQTNIITLSQETRQAYVVTHESIIDEAIPTSNNSILLHHGGKLGLTLVLDWEPDVGAGPTRQMSILYRLDGGSPPEKMGNIADIVCSSLRSPRHFEATQFEHLCLYLGL